MIALSRGGNHHSMLKRMGLDQTISLPSHIGQRGLPNLPLLITQVPEGTKSCFLKGIAECGTKRRIGLQQWRDEIVFDDGRNRLTRDSLLWIVRDKEGVAHFDLSVTSSSAYSALFDQGHADYYYQKMADDLGVVACFQNSSIDIVKRWPPANSSRPPLHPERYPLLGGIDGAIRTMGTEVLVALGEADF